MSNWTRVLPIWWLRWRAERLRRRAEPEQDLGDIEALLAEIRKRDSIRLLGKHLEKQEVADRLRHEPKLAKLAREKEHASAAESRHAEDGESPLELIAVIVVVVGFFILVYFLSR